MKVNKIRILILLFILSMITLYYTVILEKEYENTKQSYIVFMKKGIKLAYFKNSWDNNKLKLESIERLKKRFKPEISKTDKGIYIFEFKNRNQREFYKIGDFILNTTLKIGKIELKREKDRGTIYLEVKI